MDRWTDMMKQTQFANCVFLKKLRKLSQILQECSPNIFAIEATLIFILSVSFTNYAISVVMQ
jgi:hypothetical protein